MLDVGKMIAQIRKDRGMSQIQLARKANLTKQTISNYERGERKPDYVTLETIADILNVPVSMLISREEQQQALSSIYAGYIQSAENVKSLRVPVLGSIPAGIPLEEIEDIEDWEEIPTSMARGGKKYFALTVHGNSMYPKYEEGDIIIFRQSDTCENGQDCAVRVDGGEATFKRVRITDNGLMLVPINPDYESYVYTNEQVSELPVTILGVAVERRQKL